MPSDYERLECAVATIVAVLIILCAAFACLMFNDFATAWASLII